MAAGISNEVTSAQVSKRTVSDKNHVVCDCCGKITAELNEVKLELGSFREILRVLQAEIREISPPTQPTENKGIEGYGNKAPFTPGVVKLALSDPQGVSEALQGVYDR